MSNTGLFRRVFGTFDWAPPPWWAPLAARVDRATAWAAAHRGRAAAGGVALLFAVALVAGGSWWWRTRPQPQYVPVTVEAPTARDLNDPESKPAPLVIRFREPAAPIAAIGAEVGAGVKIAPAVAGRWRWEDESTLRFEPAGDWPVGQRYGLQLERRALLREGLRLESDRLAFSSAPFTATIVKAEFYQDPVDPQTKKAVVTVRFSHPVDTGRFERAFRLLAGRESQPFTATYDEKRLFAYVQSATLAMAEQASQLRVVVGKDLRSALGGPELGVRLAASVTIPGRFSLAVEQSTPGYVTNERFESEQVLTLGTSEGVVPAELAKRTRAWLLPVQHPDKPVGRGERPFDWNTPALVADEILAQANRIALEPVEAAEDHPTLHAFRFRAPVGRYLYVRVDKGLKSFGGFELGRPFDATAQVGEPPKEVKLLQSGSLLSLRGERKLALYSRDVPAIRYEIGRVQPDRLYLLASQADGAFGNPRFNGWSLGFDDLSEVETAIQPVAPAAAPGLVQYHGFDLSPYLAPGGRARTGVFFIRAQGWDPLRKQGLDAQDERLVLVTDLGILVKRAVDGTEDVFVQSVSRGEPVAGAIVQLLGRNGLALATRTTDEQGRAQLPSMRGARRDREPMLYLVRKDEDASFLPAQRSERALDLSRFDVGGVSNATEAGQLSAYLFSDRGIYRPGDEMKLGLIVKAADWAKPIEGLPLEAVIADPRGQVVKRQRLRLSASGFEELSYATAESSPTGVYDVSVYIVKDGAPSERVGNTVVNVQEFLPDRMKLALRFSTESEAGWVSPAGLAASVDLRTLFDTPAGGRRVTGMLRLTPRLPQFAAWKDWQFADPAKAKKSFEDTLAETSTAVDGTATLPLGLQRFAPGTYALQLVVQAFEPGGGRGVTQARTLLVSDQAFLVGLKADGDLGYVARDAARKVEIVALDPALRPWAAEGLRAAIVERRFVSVLERQADGTLRYESRAREIPVDEQPLVLRAGRAARALPTATPGDFALLVRDGRGRELNRIEYSVAGAGNVARRLDRNAELELKLARPDFTPGEEIEVSIRAPFTGAGLITIERERVHAFKWFRTDTTSSVQRIRLPEGFDGNGYVSVAFVRDPNSAEVFTSPLSYGVVPFSVDLGRRKVQVKLDAPATLRPGETLALTYSANRRSRIVVFGVDEGILQVAGWRTPDPLGFFFEKRALEVDTRQILDLLLPEFQKLMQSAPGGDAEGGGAKYLNPFKRRRDKPVAFWSGMLDAGPQPATFRYTVPDSFNGSMRLVAVAVAADSIGVATGTTVSRGDFVILPNAPLSVAPGDEFEFTAGVTHNIAVGGATPVDVTTRLEVSAQFEVIGASQVQTPIAAGREGVVRFRLRARQALGSGSLKLVVSAGPQRASSTTTVSLRPAATFQAQLQSGSFDTGRAELPLARQLRPERRRLEATISQSPLAIAGGLEAWLADYPYGCTEQLVSQALPAVLLAARPELGRTNLPGAPERYARLLVELRARQNADGGFGYWPADVSVAEYPSVYALHALVEAQQRGQAAPRDVLDRGGDWLAQFAAAKDGGLGLERARAYAIYVLTRMGRVASNHANAQVERLDARYPRAWRSDITAAWLAAAYQTMKQTSLANELAGGVKFADAARPWPVDDSDRAGGFVYTAAVHDAQLAFLLARHFPERLRHDAPAALAALTSGKVGYNTASAAWTVLALDAWAAAAEAAPPAALGIDEVLAADRSRALAPAGTLVRRTAFSGEARALRFTAPRGTRAFYTATLAGYDREPPTTELRQGLEITRDYVDAAGKRVTTVKQGDELTVRVRFRTLAKREIWDGVVVDVLPGGFEPILDELVRAPQGDSRRTPAAGEGGVAGAAPIGASAGPRAASPWYPDYVDVREDRVIAFGPIGPSVRELTYRIRATTAGRFAVPPAYAESMYDPAAQARSLGTQVTVEAR